MVALFAKPESQLEALEEEDLSGVKKIVKIRPNWSNIDDNMWASKLITRVKHFVENNRVLGADCKNYAIEAVPLVHNARKDASIENSASLIAQSGNPVFVSEEDSLFERLKCKAVQLERQLEEMVSQHQLFARKLNQSTMCNDICAAEEGASVPAASWREESSLQQEIERLLARSQFLIQGEMTQAAGRPRQQAIVGRCREIMMDLKSDFGKSRQIVHLAAGRWELLQGTSTASVQAGDGQAMDRLMRERNHIDNSIKASNGIINQAEIIRTELHEDGHRLRNAQGVVDLIDGSIPSLNTLIENIRSKKNRDGMIVVEVLAGCMVFSLWYMIG